MAGLYNEGLMSTPEGTVCLHPGKLLVLRATPLQGMCEHKLAANSLNSKSILGELAYSCTPGTPATIFVSRQLMK